MRSVTRLCAGLLLLVVFAAPASAEKSLHWRALDVSARLDADGVLHVVERHAMVFTGDWNGGERVFRLFPGQQLTFEALKRVDPRSGVEQDLVHGDLSGVDRYAFTSANTLRWRSRLPSDPPFDDTELDYLISYRLSGILLRRGDIYTLDHNFALPEASQTIETFSVDLDLDPVWTAAPGLVRRRTAGPLPPGSDVVVHADLAYTGAAVPGSVRTGTSTTVQLVLFAALLGAVAVIGAAFIRRETALGRFVPIAGTEAVGAAWLDQHVFNLRPEEAGALWDDTVGPPEVAAVLARLTAAEKITTWTTDGELSMRLNEPLDSFDGYEKALLTGLFFGRHTETSTSEIKAHYKAEGFDPSAKIKPGLLHALSGHPDFQDTASVPSRWPTLALFAAALVLFGVFGPSAALEEEAIAESAMAAVALWLVGLIAARAYQSRVQRPGWWALSFAWVPAVFLLGAVGRIGSASTSPVLLLAALCLLQVAIVNNISNVAKTRQGPNKLARRRELVAARRFFARELKRPQPQMKDAWFPWLVAFGLGPKVDRWFRAYGAATAVHTGGSSSSASSSSTGSSSTGGGFTGGGGMSGGGGASGSWAVAAGALAAGVSAPSSSGGSSGGGGGSSGGGGGGGW